MIVNETSGSDVRRNVEYGRVGTLSLQLDAFLPGGAGPFPAAIVVHGGGWVAGDRRSNVEPLFRPLVEGGFACFSISYRLAKDIAALGAAVEDVDQAIRYVRAHAPEFKSDREKIAVVGESAGGQLALMAALGKSGSVLKAVLSLYAPTDLEQLASQSKIIPEPFRHAMKGLLHQLSPVHHVHSGMPPFLLIHGTADPLVPFEQSRLMCRAIREAGGQCDLLAVNGGVHGLRRWESAGLTTYKRLMIEWLQKRMA